VSSPIALCPRCEMRYYVQYGTSGEARRKASEAGIYPPALSRVDNETYICNDCGTDEALSQFTDGFLAPVESWPVRISVLTERITNDTKAGMALIDLLDTEDGEA